jgi:hypothetical protein
MPARQPDDNEPDSHDAAAEPMTREQWLAYHVARAPAITPQQWADTLLLLRTRTPDDDENHDEKKAS